jgi:methionyl-tRNA formyltransferase
MAKIGFIGCHEISFHCLKEICKLSNLFNDEIKVVFNLPHKLSSKYSASTNFESLKEEFGFPLFHTENMSTNENLQLLKNANLDILFIIGWHRIVPQIVLDQSSINIGIHTSLLPKDRGSSPLNWQLIKGKKESGVTLFHLSEGVDSGAIIDQKKFSLDENDTIQTAYYKSTIISLELLSENWRSIHNLKPRQIIQNESEVTINERRRISDGLINWNMTSIECYNWIRALTFPYPGAFTFWNGKKILIWKARVSNKKEKRKPGTIIQSEKMILISTGDGNIEVSLLQVEDEPLCNSELFKKSYQLKENDIFQNS